MSVDDDIKWLEDDMAKAVSEVLSSRTKVPYTMPTTTFDPSKVIVTINNMKIDPDCYGDGATIGRDKRGREYTEKLSDQLVLGDVVFSVFYSGVWSDAGPYEITRITGGTVYGRHVQGQRSGEETRLIDHLDRMPLRVLYKPAPKSKQQTSSHWNGKCARCGRNTYTGMNNVEHEGGSCDV